MDRTFRYMFRQLFWPLVFAVIAIAGIVWMSQSLRFVDLVLNRGLPAYTLFWLAFLVLPMYTSVFLPIVLFGTVVFTYNRMAMDSELVIWRACGMGPAQLARPALAMAGVVMAVCYALNVYFMPTAYRQFKDLQNAIRSNYSQVFLREGAFNEIGDGLTVYVRDRTANGELLGILVNDHRDNGPPVTMMAERGALVHTEYGPRVVMVHGNRQTIDRSEGKLSILYFDRYTLDLGNKETGGGPRWREPKERYLGELFDPATTGPHAKDNIRMRQKLLAEGHERLVSPWLALAFTMIALAALLTGDFDRRGQGRRIAYSCVAMLMVQWASINLYNVAGGIALAVPFMYLVPIATILVCSWILFRSRRQSHPAHLPVQA